MGMRHWTPGRQTADLSFQLSHVILPPTTSLLGTVYHRSFTPTHRSTVTHQAGCSPDNLHPLTGSASGLAGVRLTLVLALTVILELT